MTDHTDTTPPDEETLALFERLEHDPEARALFDAEHPLESRGPDLRLAVSRGFFIAATPGIEGGVRLDGGVLRYDPAMPRAERAPLVVAALRERGTRGPRRHGAPAPARVAEERRDDEGSGLVGHTLPALEILLVPGRSAGLWRVRVTGSGPDGSQRSTAVAVACGDVSRAACAGLDAWLAEHAPSEEQSDGRACVRCGAEDGPMRPAGERDGVQLFACAECEGAAHGFRVDGETGVYSLAAMLAANGEDDAIGAWLLGARPGDRWAGVVSVECVDVGARGPEGAELGVRVTPHEATAEAADHLRRVIARRRDHLVGVQRRGYSPARAAVIASLAVDYGAALRIALEAGAESTDYQARRTAGGAL